MHRADDLASVLGGCLQLPSLQVEVNHDWSEHLPGQEWLACQFPVQPQGQVRLVHLQMDGCTMYCQHTFLVCNIHGRLLLETKVIFYAHQYCIICQLSVYLQLCTSMCNLNHCWLAEPGLLGKQLQCTVIFVSLFQICGSLFLCILHVVNFFSHTMFCLACVIMPLFYEGSHKPQGNILFSA